MDPGFVRITHRRCEDCDIREDLHASGSPLPKRRHAIARCQTCGGKGEIPLDRKSGVDPYAGRVPQGRPQFYESKRKKRAHAERHRFRATTYLFEECDAAMQEPPGGFNYGRSKNEDGSWSPLETEGYDPPSFKHFVEPLKHGTRYAYQKAKCRCFVCRRWNADLTRRLLATPISDGVSAESTQVYAPGVFPEYVSLAERNVTSEVGSAGTPTYLDAA